MDLVEHHPTHIRQGARVLENRVAQNLGGHHQHLRAGCNGHIARHQAGVQALRSEVPELLVRQSLDGGGVDRPPSARDRIMDGVFGYQGLARPGRGRNQHIRTGLNGFHRLGLEVIERVPPPNQGLGGASRGA